MCFYNWTCVSEIQNFGRGTIWSSLLGRNGIRIPRRQKKAYRSDIVPLMEAYYNDQGLRETRLIGPWLLGCNSEHKRKALMVSNAQTHTVRELPLGQRGWGVWNAFVGRRPFRRGTPRGQVGTAHSGRVCMSSKHIRDEWKSPQIREVLNIKHHRSQDHWHLWWQVKTRHTSFGTGLYAIKPN